MRRFSGCVAVAACTACAAGCELVFGLDGLTGGDAGSTRDGSWHAPEGSSPSPDGASGVDGTEGSDAAHGLEAGTDGPTTGADASDSSASDVIGTDTAPTVLAFVQGAGSSESGPSGKLAISSTGAGDLLVVAIVQESGTAAAVVSIVDNAPGGPNTYVSANQRSVDARCANTAEIWYAKNVRPGTTSVAILMSASVTFEAWVAEFSGASTTSPLDTGAAASSQPATTVITAPTVTPSVPNAVVLSVAASCGAISGLAAGSPFHALATKNGEDAAYYVASQTGAYGAVWSTSGGTWNGSTAAFK
jgi:hypothetical protein